ncbi:MAG: ribose 5-phosphate isomerase B [Eubacteriales bacterium]|nr:ribose 5-phosphate isomerase B [Eubacteriales bacterium]MDD3882195.1 ribose 5-phosphate isomerase B [Eubacteriales bacterium]MDD4512544.1 ribose 5-phosphate isomerase B [Eubacteriales bacterium]
MIAIGCDQGGFALKQIYMEYLKENGYEFEDFGSYDEKSIDYPVIAKKVCAAIQQKQCDKGILICGTGIGMSIAANKMKGIRASVCHEAFTAEITRRHNDSNVLCVGARVIGSEVALSVLKAWLTAEFEGGRHQRRVDLMTQMENEQ